ncbi:cytochrome P450 2G1-like [Pelobates cultripes]|uniref:Cytochrome P450 2G1-like n=1 Tax=Pelobates cultripes TaxID=61616 RepID=A0AAD1S6B4_PELCU|nr:cytochrome P450 2G1-like [Pelobates cultripes]
MLSTILLGVLVILVLYILSTWRKMQNLPPGPTPWPVIGNIHQINKLAPYETFTQLGKKYGDVFTIYFGWKPVVVLHGYDTLKDALLGQADDFSGRAIVPVFERIANRKGLVFSNGPHWHQQRRFTLSTLRDLGMGKRSIEERVKEEARFLWEFFEKQKGKPFNPAPQVTAAVSNVICSTVFGERFDTEDEKFQKLLRMISENISFLGKRGFQMYNTYPSILKWLPGEHNKIFQNASDLQGFLNTLLENHKLTRDPNCPGDFVDAFLNKIDEEAGNPDSHFTMESLVYTTFNLFIAGTETTASTIRWALRLMLLYPEIQKKVQNEIDSVLGSEKCPSLEDRVHLPYTDAVLHEVQRFASIVPNGLPHEALTDISFKGYTIPKGTQIVTFLHSALYDKKYFENPDLFNPDRFLNENGKFVKNEALLVFGAGKRQCIGESLAKTEIFIFFISLLQKFNLKYPPGEDSPLELDGGGTRAPKPYNLCAEWRI